MKSQLKDWEEAHNLSDQTAETQVGGEKDGLDDIDDEYRILCMYEAWE